MGRWTNGVSIHRRLFPSLRQRHVRMRNCCLLLRDSLDSVIVSRLRKNTEKRLDYREWRGIFATLRNALQKQLFDVK